MFIGEVRREVRVGEVGLGVGGGSGRQEVQFSGQ